MSPFGFDPLETERRVNEVKSIKTYLDVTVDCIPTGHIRPISFTWIDGREFKIDKIISIQKGSSLKTHSSGLRYRCQTGKRQYYLYFDSERWFIEK